jgi:hypothetical protein
MALAPITPAFAAESVDPSPRAAVERIVGDLGPQEPRADSPVVPESSSEPIEFEADDGAEVRMTLPFAERDVEAETAGSGITEFDNENGSTSLPVVHDDGSVQVFTVIDSAAAPTRYEYAIELDDAGRLVREVGGSVSVLDADGGFVAGIAPAWAKDADGDAIPTDYEVDGSTLTQVVHHREGMHYPVVADPYMGSAIVSRVAWIKRSSAGRTVQVFPTEWGRAMGGLSSANNAGWAEVNKKTSGANTQQMRWQYDCHSAIAAWKSSWNLDTWIRRSSYLDSVRHMCN